PWPPRTPPASAGPAGGSDLAASLAQLAALAREGLLTPEEFSAAKARLLST
ncbi:SHOCT domain-containing protein, partial [Streptomyces sp. WAC05292]